MKKKYCKTCNTATRHSAVADGDEKNGIIRCEKCGRRPDRPRDGHKIKVTCPECGKRTTARYFDDDGMDTYSVECEKCGPVMMAYDYLVQSQTKTHKDSLRIAKAEGRKP